MKSMLKFHLYTSYFRRELGYCCHFGLSMPEERLNLSFKNPDNIGDSSCRTNC